MAHFIHSQNRNQISLKEIAHERTDSRHMSHEDFIRLPIDRGPVMKRHKVKKLAPARPDDLVATKGQKAS